MPFADPAQPLTPCVGICRLDGAGLCIGCRRTMNEIARWSHMSDSERQRLMRDELPGRDEPPS